MTSFSLFKYLDAFELDANVVNFVYYGKTRFRKNSTAILEVIILFLRHPVLRHYVESGFYSSRKRPCNFISCGL